MYSFGLIVYDMFFHPPTYSANGLKIIRAIPAEGKQVPESKVKNLGELLKSLLVIDPAARPEARKCLTLPFFAENLDPNRDTSKDLVSCQLCLDDQLWHDEGIQCANGHFSCKNCFNNHVESLNDEDILKVKRRKGELTCPAPGCSVPYNPEAFMKLMEKAAHDVYIRKKLELKETEVVDELEKIHKEAMDRLEKELQAEKSVASHRKAIEELLVTLKCPRCSLKFDFFVGCFSVSCSKCPVSFGCLSCLIMRLASVCSVGGVSRIAAPMLTPTLPIVPTSHPAMMCGAMRSSSMQSITERGPS